MNKQQEIKDRCIRALDQVKDMIMSPDYDINEEVFLTLSREPIPLYCKDHQEEEIFMGPIEGEFRFSLLPVVRKVAFELCYYSNKGNRKIGASGLVDVTDGRIVHTRIYSNRILKFHDKRAWWLESDQGLYPTDITIINESPLRFSLIHRYTRESMRSIVIRNAKEKREQEATMDTTKAKEEKKD